MPKSNKKGSKYLKDQLDSIAEFKATRKSAGSHQRTRRGFLTMQLIFLFFLLIGFVFLVLARFTLSSPEYIGDVKGEIISACIYSTRKSIGPGSLLCQIKTEKNQVVSVAIGDQSDPKKGNLVLLRQYKVKTLIGDTYQYEFDALSR